MSLVTTPAPAGLLAAGPVTARLQGLDVVDVRIGGAEILRRIGVRVRDPDWETVPPVACDVTATSVQARHAGGALDFAWTGSIASAEDGTLVYAIDGRALCAFAYGRIGLVVLHPPSVAGRPYRIETPAGSAEGRLPRLVAPQPMAGGVASPLLPAFTRLEIDVDARTTVALELAGDLFEMEDQRNWTDGSFKTYSTPVGLPTPRYLEEGDGIRQRVRVSARTSPPPAARRMRAARAVRLRLGSALATEVPPVGIGLGSEPPGPRALAALHELAPAHVRADVQVDRHDVEAELERAGQVAATLGAELELALILAGDEAAGRRAMLRLKSALERQSLVRVMVFHRDEWVTAARWLDLVREALPTRVQLLAGTDFHFAELNRERPVPRTGHGLVYSVSPQVHDDDEETMIQSLEAQGATVRTAHVFAAGRSVHVSPITLKPRFNPYAARPTLGPPPADPRQSSPFAAAWTLGSVKYLAEAGAASLTYFELTGPRGVLAARPLPVYEVLRDVCAWRGRKLIDCRSSQPLVAEGLFVLVDREVRGAVANLTSKRQTVQLVSSTADTRTLELAPYEVARVTVPNDPVDDDRGA